MECGRPAERLQHQLQRLPQHDERIHSIIEQSDSKWTDYRVFRKRWPRGGNNLLLQSGGGRRHGSVASVHPGERDNATIEFWWIRVPRGIHHRQPMEHRFPGGGNHREHRDRWHHKLDAEMDVPWQSANHQSVERELFAKQRQRDREQLELQRGHSAGRKVQRGGLYRKLQRNECTACELLSEWSHLPLVSEFVDLAMFRADKRLAAPCM